MSANNIRTPEECAQAQLDAYNARDISGFSAVYSQDVELRDLSSGEVFCAGRPALDERYGKMFADHPELHCTLVHRTICGSFVMDEEHVVGLHPDMTVHAVATYEVENGFITKAWFVRERASA